LRRGGAVLMSSASFGGSEVRSPASETVQLGCTETSQNGKVTLRIFVINLHHTPNEELLFLRRPGLPVIWFLYGDCKTDVAGPSLALCFLFVCRDHVHKVLNSAQVFHIPCFADRKAAV
jgi:hypothetical protein